MMDIVNASGTGLGSGVCFLSWRNDKLKKRNTFLLTDQIVLHSDVDWVFPTLHTIPWRTRYIPSRVFKQVDIKREVGVTQKVKNGKSFVLLHVEVPSDGGLVIPWLVVVTVVTPSVLSYVNLARIYGSQTEEEV